MGKNTEIKKDNQLSYFGIIEDNIDQSFNSLSFKGGIVPNQF